MKDMIKPYQRTVAAGLAAAALMIPAGTSAAALVTEQEANSIAVNAYLYFYPLVTMDLTRQQMANVERPVGFHSPMDTLRSLPDISGTARRGSS